MSAVKFKVGDEVVINRHDVIAKGSKGTVTDASSSRVMVAVKGFTEGHGAGCCNWNFYSHGGFDGINNLSKVTKPTLADDLSFKPSTRRVLAHMRKKGSITVLEALAAYGTARIAPAIHDLRNGGYDIETVSKEDAGGHKYTRYYLTDATGGRKKAA